MVVEAATDIAADRHDVAEGEYFDPNGIKISEVVNGTGKQILCSEDGVRVWELTLAHNKRTHLIMRHADGSPFVESEYVDGLQDGEYVSYYPGGSIRSQGQYSSGNQVGVWLRFREDGAIESRTDFGGGHKP
jgi:antitoxin component YwqK of YwqJK toxin-antitoxin module